MELAQALVGTRVRANTEFFDVPEGTEGVIDEDYGTGVMVAWDLPSSPLPAGYFEWKGRHPGRWLLRDGFDKETELQYLDIVAESPIF